MNTQQIKRAKRLAEILGKEAHDFKGMLFLSGNFGEAVNTFKDGYVKGKHLEAELNRLSFNPEQDKALLWDLMVRYKEEIDMDDNFIYTKDSGIPAALIDCVIEINGGYDE